MEVLVALFVGLWTYASVSKMINHDKFISVLYAAKLFGNYTVYLSWLVPALELLIAISIVLPSTRFVGLMASLIYLLLLSAYLLYMILFSSSLPCTCGGLISSFTWLQHFWLNCMLMLITVVIIIVCRKIYYRIAIPSQKFRPEQLWQE